MDQVIDFFSGLFDTSLWPPRWHCGHWTEFHGWLYIISDLLIFSAYFAIPVIIVRYIATRTDSRFHKIYFLFAAFILACGFTHLLDAITFWYPVYRFNALIRFITGLISWLTVYYLIKLLPVAFSLKTAGELEIEVEQRKKVEEDLKVKIQLLNEAQEIAKMGHWEWSAGSNMITISNNLFKIFGIEPQTADIPYEHFLACVHPEDRHVVETTMQQALTDKSFTEFYYRVITPDKLAKTIQMKGEVITGEDLNPVKIIGTSQDVTKQKENEQELLVKTNQLEAKNGELQKFAYIASHDLQEPLRKIRTFISRLQVPEANDSQEKAKLYIEKIDNAASRMQKLIEDILNFSRISTGNDSLFSKTDLNIILRSVLNDMEVAIDNKNIIINAAALPVMNVNASQMGQLFQNILSNAIKFRKAEGPLKIDIDATIVTGAEIDMPDWIKVRYRFSGWKETRFWLQEKFCKITITDNGIGFEQEYAERIFEAFQRLSKNYEGTGIGLAICKKIVEIHHGTIAALSTPGKGTSFIIVLPLSQANFE